ncbi:hypothetical protein HOY82DRAFT_392221 [Tuber indicum]|nr:hypothetical protein HOY82DRAFT_392221 [Tuber indicum]
MFGTFAPFCLSAFHRIVSFYIGCEARQTGIFWRVLSLFFLFPSFTIFRLALSVLEYSSTGAVLVLTDRPDRYLDAGHAALQKHVFHS